MANANFLEEFDKSLQKLGQLNNIIAANTQKKYIGFFAHY